MLKMQHPEYELYTAGSTHFNAGVSCADCHMPYVRDGAVKFSSHDTHSPLFNPAEACGACHTDVNFVANRARQLIQDQVWATMTHHRRCPDRWPSTPSPRRPAEARPAWTPPPSKKPASCTAPPDALGLHRRREQHGLPQPRRSPAHPGAATDLARQAQSAKKYAPFR
jgi:hypothetical protein